MRLAEGFSYRNNVLHCGNTPVPEIVTAAGTPLYLYNLDAVVDRYRSYADAFSSRDHLTCYAVKANSSLALLQVLAREGCGFDVNSRGELFRVMKASADPAKISMTGVGKSAADIRDGLNAGIATFNVESLEECARIDTIADSMGKTASIMLRLNPDITAGAHPYIATGSAKHKFGLGEDDLYGLVQNLHSMNNLRLIGFAMHIGSQIVELQPFIDGLRKLFSFAKKVADSLPEAPQVFDIGGGLGVCYQEDHAEISARDFAQTVTAMIEESGLSVPKLLSEPGRYLVANCGVLLSRVEYVKRTSGKTFVIIDAGMNDFLRPALYKADHVIMPVAITDAPTGDLVDVVGPVCESGDTFVTDYSIQRLEEHELVAVLSTGAYSSVMASNYNSRPLPAEATCYKGDWQISRSRQTLEQLVQNEHLLYLDE